MLVFSMSGVHNSSGSSSKAGSDKDNVVEVTPPPKKKGRCDKSDSSKEPKASAQKNASSGDSYSVAERVIESAEFLAIGTTFYDAKEDAKVAWKKHKHQLFCALCESQPDNEEYEEYWGECGWTCPLTEKETTLVLCPQCLNSTWTLYKPLDMKVGRPTFNDSLSLTAMRWDIAKGYLVSKYVQARVEIMKHPLSVSAMELFEKLKPISKRSITIQEINQWQMRPLPKNNPFAILGLDHFTIPLKSDIPEEPYRYKTGPPTVLRKLLTNFVTKYEACFVQKTQKAENY